LSVPFPTNEKENSTKENNVAKIKVVVSWFVGL
jgi:kinesin family protein 2/24